MHTYRESTLGIEVEVIPEYIAAESSPQSSHFVYAYHITITNKGENEVQLLNRHWIITNGDGNVEEVKGEGVVGEKPKLAPGQKHEYSSFCPLTTPTGNMRGSFEMVNKQGRKFEVKIPLFFLKDTSLMH